MDSSRAILLDMAAWLLLHRILCSSSRLNSRLFPKSPYFNQMLQLSAEPFQSHTGEALQRLLIKGEATFSHLVLFSHGSCVLGLPEALSLQKLF